MREQGRRKQLKLKSMSRSNKQEQVSVFTWLERCQFHHQSPRNCGVGCYHIAKALSHSGKKKDNGTWECV